ncbi:unnamed protein product [Coregonus sp. 'balchen']|nr:unnamed protein product [Coregonus sp. 'balchen']
MVTVTVTSPDNIIIFGASGFIRQFVVEEARGAAEGPSGSLKWASAGQSRQWLEGVLNHPPESDAPVRPAECDLLPSMSDRW